MGHRAEERAKPSADEPVAVGGVEAQAEPHGPRLFRKAWNLQEAAQFWIEATSMAFPSPASFNFYRDRGGLGKWCLLPCALRRSCWQEIFCFSMQRRRRVPVAPPIVFEAVCHYIWSSQTVVF